MPGFSFSLNSTCFSRMKPRRITRFQHRRQQELVSASAAMEENDCPQKRRNSSKTGGIPNDDKGVSCYIGVVGRRSFPLEHDTTDTMIHQQKTSKTDTTTKQKRTLAERATNTFTNEKLAKIDVKSYRKRSLCDTDSLMSSTSSAPWIIANTSDEIMTENDNEEESMENNDGDDNEEDLLCDETMLDARQDQDDFKPESPPIVQESPMEFNPQKCKRKEKERKQLPEGVRDIDFDSDSLKTCEYASEIMTYCLHTEKKWMLETDFLDKSPDVTPRMRSVLMDWLVQVQAHEELKEETLHLCVWLIDRFLSIVDIRMPKLQLVGITCLLIASKFVERFAPEITTLCHLTDNTFRPQQVIRYEWLVLKGLNFFLRVPVCTTFLDRYLQVHDEEESPIVGFLARYLLDLSITNSQLATVLPSLLAAGALYLARRLVFRSSHVWTASLHYYTTYTEGELVSAVNELANMLFKAPASKFQGSRSKYNTEQYSFISHSDLIRPENIIFHFETQEGTAV